jgi:shikimate dehydrogenase
MKYFGLIGFPLSHSFSKGYFTEKFTREGIRDCQYENYPIEHIGLLPELLRSIPGMAGLNVTIPYKKQVIALLDELDDEAEQVGAVNTIAFIKQGGRSYLRGYNTDVFGFRMSISPLIRPHYRKAIILGTGGSSKAVAFVLESMGLEVSWVSRNPAGEKQMSYAQLNQEMITHSQVIINTSPVGMYPRISDCPEIPYEFLTPDHLLFDLIYNPSETGFLERGKQRGAQIMNGLQMLYLQAERSWDIWKG